jgi:hypothetical protein
VETEKPSLVFTAPGNEPTDAMDLSLRAKAQYNRQYSKQYNKQHVGQKKQYDASREQSRSGGFARLSSKHGQFVAIDSEGLNRGAPFKKDDATMQDQRTCLWMAGGVNGIPNAELVNIETGLSSNGNS